MKNGKIMALLLICFLFVFFGGGIKGCMCKEKINFNDLGYTEKKEFLWQIGKDTLEKEGFSINNLKNCTYDMPKIGIWTIKGCATDANDKGEAFYIKLDIQNEYVNNGYDYNILDIKFGKDIASAEEEEN